MFLPDRHGLPYQLQEDLYIILEPIPSFSRAPYRKLIDTLEVNAKDSILKGGAITVSTISRHPLTFEINVGSSGWPRTEWPHSLLRQSLPSVLTFSIYGPKRLSR